MSISIPRFLQYESVNRVWGFLSQSVNQVWWFLAQSVNRVWSVRAQAFDTDEIEAFLQDWDIQAKAVFQDWDVEDKALSETWDTQFNALLEQRDAVVAQDLSFEAVNPASQEWYALAEPFILVKNARIQSAAQARDARVASVTEAYDSQLDFLVQSRDAEVRSVVQAFDPRIQPIVQACDARVRSVIQTCDVRVKSVTQLWDARIKTITQLWDDLAQSAARFWDLLADAAAARGGVNAVLQEWNARGAGPVTRICKAQSNSIIQSWATRGQFVTQVWADRAQAVTKARDTRTQAINKVLNGREAQAVIQALGIRDEVIAEAWLRRDQTVKRVFNAQNEDFYEELDNCQAVIQYWYTKGQFVERRLYHQRRATLADKQGAYRKMIMSHADLPPDPTFAQLQGIAFIKTYLLNKVDVNTRNAILAVDKKCLHFVLFLTLYSYTIGPLRKEPLPYFFTEETQQQIKWLQKQHSSADVSIFQPFLTNFNAFNTMEDSMRGNDAFEELKRCSSEMMEGAQGECFMDCWQKATLPFFSA